MKNPSLQLLTAYQQGFALQSSIKVYAEWNLNRFIDSVVTDNGIAPADTEWDNLYPKKSVVAANRPDSGIVRSRMPILTGSFTDDRANAAGLKLSPGFVDSKPGARYYLVSPDDAYTYWNSYKTTNGSSNAQGTFFFPEPQSLSVVYTSLVTVNKIVINLEISDGLPKNYAVQVTTNGSSWTTVAQNSPIDANGKLTVWFSDTWIAGNQPSNFTNNSKTTIRGIKFIADGMTKQGAGLSIIEISGRWFQDLSDYIVSEDNSFEVSDTSNISPIGVASSNQASVVLDNTASLFNNENEESPFYKLLDKNVLMWCDYVINNESFRQWTMYTDDWKNQLSDSVSVSLFDSAEPLQNIKVPATFWEGMTAGSIIWRLFDMAGFSNWNYKSSINDVIEVPYFWTDPEKSVWETIQDVAQGTQTAVYFDEYNVAQIQNAKTLFDKQPLPVWYFNSEDNGSSLADIIEIEKTAEYEANQVDIKYTETKFTDFNNGLPKMEVVWEPDDTVVLRATALLYDMDATQKNFVLPMEEAATWPLEGYANIEGEIVAYKGKYYRSYSYFDNGTYVYNDSLITSEDERKKLDELTPEGIRWRNGYNGWFVITDRGLFGTTARPHAVDYKYKYTYEVVTGGSTSVEHYPGGVVRNSNASTVTLKGRSDFTWNTLYTLRTTESAKATDYRYGTRIRFPSAGQPVNKGAGGLYIKGGSFNSGFYIDLAPTDLVEKIERATRNELRFQIRTRAGVHTTTNYIPPPVQINRDTWYDLEASTTLLSNGNMQVIVYIDGVIRYNTIIRADEIADTYGRFGTFIRDNCIAEFDYLYAVGMEDNSDPDNANFYDNVKGGYVGNYFDKVVPYKDVTPGVISRATRGTRPAGSAGDQQWLEEFGPVVHEIRKYDVDFEKSPVAHSYLYFSNLDQLACPAYVADSFGASFLLANTYRRNVVVSGEDTLTFGTDNSVEQKIFVYGRAFSDEEEQTETVKSEDLIRKRGLNAITFQSPYIQSKASAQRLGTWIVSHWGSGTEQYQLDVFGNPFISLGDIVSVNYPGKEIYPTTKFCVVSISRALREGITTSLTLRKL